MARSVKKTVKKTKKKDSHERKKYNQWDTGRLKSALKEFELKAKDGKPNLRMIARAWGIPKSTLQRRLKGSVVGTAHCSGRKPVLSESAEKELVSVIELLCSRGFPLGMKEIRDLAYQYSEKNGLNAFPSKHREAGYYWFTGFMHRHPELRIRKPEALSAARAMSMNKPVIDKWFTEYENLLTTLGIKHSPDHIWNCDETGLMDHFERRKAVGSAGQPCYQITANERGQTTTVLACFNAVGTFAPLLFVLKGSRLQSKWCVGAPVGSLVRVSPNGWITSSLFAEWAAKFVASLPSSDHRPNLLLLDGHASHVYNLEFLNLMKANNVHIYCFPPHCSHWLQPADKSLFKSVKHHWNEAGWNYTKRSGGGRLQRDEFFSLFLTAWPKAATVETAQNGFRSTGLFPVNRNAIPNTAFAPSQNTDRPAGLNEQSLDVTGAVPPVITAAVVDNSSDLGPAVTIHSDTVTSDVDSLIELSHSLPSSDSVTAAVTCAASPDTPDTSAGSSGDSASVVATTAPAADKADIEKSVMLNPAVATEMPSCTNGTDNLAELCAGDAAAYVSFASLVNVPHRERKATARKRSVPPSYNLTSVMHMSFVEEKMVNKKKTNESGNATRKDKGKRLNEKKSVAETKDKSKKKDTGRPTSKKKQISETVAETKDKSKKKDTGRPTSKKKQISETVALKKAKLNKTEKCHGCGVREGSSEDVEMAQGWIACDMCNKWYHDMCAEESGVLDDDFFTCKTCIA